MRFVVSISYSSIIQLGKITVEKHYILIPQEETEKEL